MPELDHIVLHNPVEGLEMDRWDLPIGPEGQTVYHAACDPLRVEPPRALEDYDWYPGASRGGDPPRNERLIYKIFEGI
ncbi:hypothetical protein [Sulfitobacter aestuariivivens]|uniref:hypothetical protein n=1 Tax=Sulfitobacter aestuariivivens TaxID=2766981 RepID=UPI003611D8FA